jgi:hypothetical protein
MKAFLSMLILLSPVVAQSFLGQRTERMNEIRLSSENGYDPIPSPDGKLIAYVRTGWGRSDGMVGLGRSQLTSEVSVMTSAGHPVSAKPLAEAFLEGWTPEGSELLCYRDGRYSLVALNGRSILQGELQDGGPLTERVFFSRGAVGWSGTRGSGQTQKTVIQTPKRIIAMHPGRLGDVVVPSPDGRYLAIFDDIWQSHLGIYDTRVSKWFDLGPVTVYPDSQTNSGWSYMSASWNPWFADSSRLVYVSGTNLVISKPDGSERRTIPIAGQAGLPAAAPDGKSVAYVTFDPHPTNARPDLEFWGGTIIWVLPIADGAKSFEITRKNDTTIYDLRWLSKSEIVFDRLEDEPFPMHAELWTASIYPPKLLSNAASSTGK